MSIKGTGCIHKEIIPAFKGLKESGCRRGYSSGSACEVSVFRRHGPWTGSAGRLRLLLNLSLEGTAALLSDKRPPERPPQDLLRPVCMTVPERAPRDVALREHAAVAVGAAAVRRCAERLEVSSWELPAASGL